MRATTFIATIALVVPQMTHRAPAQVAAPAASADAEGPAQYHPGDAFKPPPDVVAVVEGHFIYRAELGDAMRELPPAQQREPYEALYPLLLQDAINHAALQIEATQQKLDQDPDIRRRMQTAANRALENELLNQVVKAKVTEAAIAERYQQRYASLPGIEQRHIEVIVVNDAETASKVQQALLHGGDFATLARQFSTDPSSLSGGEVGFVSRDQLPPALAAPVFGAQPGGVLPAPVLNGDRWDIIKISDRRLAPVPPLSQVYGAIQRDLVNETITQYIAHARSDLHIAAYNIDGSPYVPPSLDSVSDPLRFDTQLGR